MDDSQKMILACVLCFCLGAVLGILEIYISMLGVVLLVIPLGLIYWSLGMLCRRVLPRWKRIAHRPPKRPKPPEQERQPPKGWK